MGLPYGWLVHLNKGHFELKPPGTDPVAYARWEYDEGKKVWKRFFSDKVKLDGKDVLDLGCGPGGKTCYLATLGPGKIVGIDFDPELVHQAERAREVLPPPEDRIRLEFVCIDATDLPFPDKYFDVIVCSDAFEHFSDPQGVLKEAARVLKPGGEFTIDFAQWGAWNGHHLGDFLKTPWAHIFWRKKDVVKAVGEIAGIYKDKIMDKGERDRVDDLVKRRIDHFTQGLNGLSIRSFERYLREESGLRVVSGKRTSASPILLPLTFIPGLMELAVARNVYIVKRLD